MDPTRNSKLEGSLSVPSPAGIIPKSCPLLRGLGVSRGMGNAQPHHSPGWASSPCPVRNPGRRDRGEGCERRVGRQRESQGQAGPIWLLRLNTPSEAWGRPSEPVRDPGHPPPHSHSEPGPVGTQLQSILPKKGGGRRRGPGSWELTPLPSFFWL